MTPGQKAITLPGRVETVTDGGEGTFINALGVFPLPRSKATGLIHSSLKVERSSRGSPHSTQPGPGPPSGAHAGCGRPSRAAPHGRTPLGCLSALGGHGGRFSPLGPVNDAAVDVAVHISFQVSAFSFFKDIPKSGIAGSHGSSAQFSADPPQCFPEWLRQFTWWRAGVL